MHHRTLATALLALTLATPLSAGTLSAKVDSNMQWLISAISSISDTIFFTPMASAQARISDAIMENAMQADRFLEAEGVIMPEPGQLTGPLEWAATKVTDFGCAISDMTLGTARVVRDGAKQTAAYGMTSAVTMAESAWTSFTSITR